jgi:hypothetical protein
MSINYRDGIAIGEVVVYSPALAIALLLAIRHGFNRSSGWLFLIIFALARIIGACFQLATINDPDNISLYVGAAILQTIGLSPLELTSLGLLSRIISSINKSHTTLVQHYHIKFIQTIVIVGLILSIIGGTDSSSDRAKTGVYTTQPLSEAAMGLYIAAFVMITATAIILSFSVSHAEHGEKRLLLALAVSLPFLLVRLVYGSISNFANTSDFNPLTGNVTIYLCMALIMELCVVITYEVVGITLKKFELPPTSEAVVDETYVQGPSKASQVASSLGRRTIIGRLITSAAGNRDGDVEMQRRHGVIGGRREARRARRYGQ